MRATSRFRTSVNHVIVMKVIDRFEDLSYGLRRILLGELPVLAYSIEQFSPGSQLGNDVVFVLCACQHLY